MRVVLSGWLIEHRLAELTEDITLPRQAHGSTLAQAQDLVSGCEADGVVIDRHTKNRVGIYTADCLPLVLLTPEVALLIHLSRHSLLAGIMQRAAEEIDVSMIQAVYFGPHICPTHFSFAYEGLEVVKFTKEFPAAVYQDAAGTHLSLALAVQHFLTAWGVNITVTSDGRCTYETTLPSYRRRREENTTILTNHLITTVVPEST